MSLPTKAYLPGIGRVRVIQYVAPGHFRVLDTRDQTRLVHRDRLTMRK